MLFLPLAGSAGGAEGRRLGREAPRGPHLDVRDVVVPAVLLRTVTPLQILAAEQRAPSLDDRGDAPLRPGRAVPKKIPHDLRRCAGRNEADVRAPLRVQEEAGHLREASITPQPRGEHLVRLAVAAHQGFPDTGHLDLGDLAPVDQLHLELATDRLEYHQALLVVVALHERSAELRLVGADDEGVAARSVKRQENPSHCSIPNQVVMRRRALRGSTVLVLVPSTETSCRLSTQRSCIDAKTTGVSRWLLTEHDRLRSFADV